MSWMARVFSQLTALLSNVSHLSFDSEEPQLDLDNSKLLPFLYLFSTVEELHVSEALAGHVAAALEKIAMVSELMPALRSLQLGDGNVSELAESIERFITFRHLSGQPVTVVN